ncbi:MAG: aminotransferase class I/II-fold pyridoxal phosphate-dependent enzyme [Bacillota bacterium]
MGKQLQEVLGEYCSSNPARFHMPGHKGRGLNGFWRGDLAQWDVTELPQTDQLHAPEAAIRQTEANCAGAFGAKRTFLLVNGSTVGIEAMLLCCSGFERVLLDRACHRSVLSGAALAGIDVDFIEPQTADLPGGFGVVDAETLGNELRSRRADAVLITSPNYYGLCADLDALSEVAKRYGAWLLVDAAHGAHFPFSKQLPPCPAGKAQLWVNSAHKTLNALGQAAFLHVDEVPGLNESRVQRMLSLVQTSSPSYLLMCSLDWARYSASLPGAWDAQVERANRVRDRIASLPGLAVLGPQAVGQAGVAAFDPTRICILVTQRGIDGYLAANALAQRGVIVEMADAQCVVCITTPADPDEWYERLIDGLMHLPFGAQAQEPPAAYFDVAKRAMPLREAVFAPSEPVPLASSKGRILSEEVGVYPPGIAAVLPGQRMSERAIAYLLEQQRRGGGLFGITQGCVSCVKEEPLR